MSKQVILNQKLTIMKKLTFLFLAAIAASFSSCDTTTDSVDKLLNEDQVSLNNTVSTVVTSEEATEDITETADYEVDLYSFVANEYDEPTTTSTKSGMMQRYMEMFKMWNRYKDGNMPDISIGFSDNDHFPMTINLNYGDSTVLNNGKVMSGMMKIELTAPPFTDGAVREITYDLMIDSVSIDGWKRIELTHNDDVARKFAFTSEMTFTFPDETQLFRKAERTREWVAGLDTKLDVSDDRIEIRGSVTCVDTEQNEYTKVIDDENPLVRIGTCRVIVSGLVTFSQNQTEFAHFDYGDGECDNMATYTYTDENGETVTKEVEIGHHNRYHNRNN